jgi:chromosome segregation ATPase
MDVLSLLRSRFAERNRTASEVVSVAARKVAAGQSVDHAALEAAMVATNTSVDAFATLVELHTTRAGWRADYEKLKDATAKRDQANAAIEREVAAFDDYRQKHQAKMAKLQADHREAAKAVDRGELARGNLATVANVPDPAAQTLRDAHDALATASDAVSSANRAIREANEGIKREESWIEHKDKAGDNDMSSKADHERSLRHWKRRLAEMEPLLAEATAVERLAAERLAAAELDAINA